MEQKYFTVNQANQALVLVRPIVRDIMTKRKKMIEIKRTVRNLKDTKKENIDEIVNELSLSLRNVSKDITYHLEELEMVGCYLKDFELGVINFPSILNGRVVFLCWMFGEVEVGFWHELTKGLAERKPITKSFTTLELQEIKKTA
jgi:hypothetical protein